MKTIPGVSAIAAALVTIGSFAGEVNAAFITFGNTNVDPLFSSGPILEGGFTYQAFGSAWDITTSLGNPGASLATAWNGAVPVIGQTVEVLSVNSSPFIFNSVDFRTLLLTSSDKLSFTGYFAGGTVGTLILDYGSTTFITVPATFNSPIDRLVIEVTGHGNNSAFVDNISLSAIPEPTSALLLGLGALGFVAFRRGSFCI